MLEIPTFDLTTPAAVLAPEIDRACREVGFLQIVGHGVPTAVRSHAWEAARAFFDLPLDEKLRVARPSPDAAYGYVPMAGEALEGSLGADAAPADLKETFNIGPVDALARPLVDDGERWAFAPVTWPQRPAGMRDAWTAYFRAMLELSTRLMRLFAVALDLPATWFDEMIDESPSALRAIDYPDQPVPPPPGALRAGAHTDYGTLTVLAQDDAPGGLEVWHAPTQRWVPVGHVPDAFVVNLGDLLQRWTNDRWRSTLHRVVNPPREATGSTRRQSMAFFHNANYHCRVACIPTCLAPGEQPRHAPVVAGPHLMAKYHRAVQAATAGTDG